MHAQLRTMANEGYIVQQIEAADGMVVREYVSSTGLVFGVAWQGPQMPDLIQLLGASFLLYEAALPAPVTDGHPWWCIRRRWSSKCPGICGPSLDGPTCPISCQEPSRRR